MNQSTILSVVLHICSETCRTPDDINEHSDADDMEIDSELSSELQGNLLDNDDSPSNSRPNSRSSSRPTSSLSLSIESQEVIVLNTLRDFVKFHIDSYLFISISQSSRDFRGRTPTTTPTAAPKQRTMKRFLDNVKPAESQKLDSLAAEFFYGCNIPFNVADSKYFKNFVKGLRPAYNPPNRRQLGSKLLDSAHENIVKRNTDLINKMDKKVTLLIDGWKNSAANRHYVVTMISTSQDLLLRSRNRFKFT